MGTVIATAAPPKRRRVRNDLKTGNPVIDTQSEDSFQAQVDHLARIYGWRVYHTRHSYQSVAGYPDDTLVRGKRLIFAELKRQTGDTSQAQEEWLADLREVPGVEVYVWRPSDFDQILRILA